MSDCITMIREFKDVRLEPSHFEAPFIFYGGPIWPDFENQTLIRQRRCDKVLDRKPEFSDQVVEPLRGRYIWAGFAHPHFGHFIADQISRLPAALVNCPVDAKLLFSLPKGIGDPKDFFYQTLEALGVSKDRIVVQRDQPIEVETLYAAPLGETLYGAPHPEYLKTISHLAAENGIDSNPDGTVYVSRARLPTNLSSLAGETYLEECLEKLGARITWPEKMTVRQQIQSYASASRLVFSEGSALHGRQLLGEIDQEITVIERRQRFGMARSLLTPRCKALRYVSAIDGAVYVNPVPNGHLWQGITVLDEIRLIEGLLNSGIDVRDVWDSRTFKEVRDREIVQWSARRLDFPPVEIELKETVHYMEIRKAILRGSLAAIGMSELYEQILSATDAAGKNER